MLVEGHNGRGQSAHVVVIGNEKGGSGKSTIAFHVAVALLKAGQRVACIDLDSRQKSLTRAIEYRRDWAKRKQLPLEIPAYHSVARSEGIRTDDNENAEFEALIRIISAVERDHDFIVIDTPGLDSYLMRLAHNMADTLITPLNDSFVDLAVLGAVDPVTFALTGRSHYSELVAQARRARRGVDAHDIDWIVVRNRVATGRSRNKRRLADTLDRLGLELAFRWIDGLAERLAYREFYPRGLTALDGIDTATLGVKPRRSHRNARDEIEALLAVLRLPADEKGRRRATARSLWFASAAQPLETHDILG